MKRNEEIEQHLQLLTQRVNWKQTEVFSATAIALELSLNRVQVSKILNAYVNEGIAVKVNSRPVLFFHKAVLEKEYAAALTEMTYNGLDELMKTLQPQDPSYIFRNLIGYRRSLKSCIDQCMAAISYPGTGLPVLLHGASGTGKSYIAQLMFEYAKTAGFILEAGTMVIVNCAEYANNPELFLTNVFGYCKGSYTGAEKDQKGLLYHADGGMLFLDEIHELPPECQEKIFLFMDKGIYHMVGDNEHWFHSSVHMIMATTETPETALLQTLRRRIALIIEIPLLKGRPIQERKELIHYLLIKEEQHVLKKLRLSRMVYHILLSHPFHGNIGELKNILKITVANALIKSRESDVIDVHVRDMPESVQHQQTTRGMHIEDDSTMLDADSLLYRDMSENRLLRFNKEIQDLFHKAEQQHYIKDTLKTRIYETIRIYIDHLYFDAEQMYVYADDLSHKILMNTMKILQDKYHLKHFSNNEIEILLRFLSDFAGYECIEEASVLGDFSRMKQLLYNSFKIQKEMLHTFTDMIKDSFLIPDRELFAFDLSLLLSYMTKEYENLPLCGIILAHGYSIASGIAEVTNQMLERHVFDAIDMPIDSEFEDVVDRLKEYLNSIPRQKEIIVLVDMGSLEIIHQHLQGFTFDIGIINNVTTRLALDIGNMMMQNKKMEDILKEANERNANHYVLVPKQDKQKIILTICETGLGVASKIAEIVNKSLPKKIDAIIIPYDYHSLKTMGKQSPLFENYDVYFILGTKNPQVEGIPYLSLYDIMDAENSEYIEHLIGKQLDHAQTKEFCKEMLKNFSIENLTEYLNIISPERIIRNVEDIIAAIQNNLHVHLDISVICGLYIHISCMMERMILQEYVCAYDHLETFCEEHKDFISIVKQAFYETEQQYNVEIPVSEIAYLYEYVYTERDSVTKIANSVENVFGFIE